MKRLASQRGGNGKSAAVDLRAGRSGGQSSNVAGRATGFVEKLGASSGGSRVPQVSVLRRRFQRADEAGEVVDIGEPVRSGLIVRLRNGIAKFGHFVGEQLRSDAHLIQIGVARERQQAGVLVFPAEPAYAGLPRSFDDGDVDQYAANLAVAAVALVARQLHQSLVRERLHKTVAEETQ